MRAGIPSEKESPGSIEKGVPGGLRIFVDASVETLNQTASDRGTGFRRKAKSVFKYLVCLSAHAVM